MSVEKISITEIPEKDKRLKVLQICMKRNYRSYRDGTKIVTIPNFLTLIFQCVKNKKHRRYLIFHREDIISKNVRFIQNCDICNSKANLVEVR